MADRFIVDEKALHELLSGPGGPVAEVVERATARVETAAKRLCPVDTGRLRASIARDRDVVDDTYVGIVGTNVEYAVPVEFGTMNQSAQPYLRPALEQVISDGIR